MPEKRTPWPQALEYQSSPGQIPEQFHLPHALQVLN